jgi:hypothetical protein
MLNSGKIYLFEVYGGTEENINNWELLDYERWKRMVNSNIRYNAVKRMLKRKHDFRHMFMEQVSQP